MLQIQRPFHVHDELLHREELNQQQLFVPKRNYRIKYIETILFRKVIIHRC
jgi:hypothetical protein